MCSGFDAGLLSVIVPVYNTLPYLEACAASVLAQTYRNIELLLVDDGSTDGSGALCDELAASDARVRVLHRVNGGLSAARNSGLDAAGGEWIGFVDSDDTVLPEMYETLIRACVENGAEIASCRFRFVYAEHESDEPDTGKVTVFDRVEAMELLWRQEQVRFEVCPKVFSRRVIGDSRFLERQVFEDIRFTRLVFPRMTRFAYVERPYYRYLQKRAGNTNSSFSLRKLETVSECDLLVRELRAEGLTTAADRMAEFTLEFLMRLYVNARACGADRETRRAVHRAFCEREGSVHVGGKQRVRYRLFSLSPTLYDVVSKGLHKRY